MDDKLREAAAACARARGRADRALALAAQEGEAASRAERHSQRVPAFLSETAARLAAIHRRSQRAHLAAARLNAAYADRLRQSMEEPGPSPLAALLAAVASVSGSRMVVLRLSGHEQAEALVAASDAVARAACDAERSYGEGPATDALAGRALVRASGDLAALWPLYGPAVHHLGIRAVSAAPLCQRGRCFGSITILDSDPDGPSAGLPVDELADALVRTLLAHEAPADRDGLPRLPLLDGDQALMHQAAGMVAAQARVDIPDALALIRSRAFADSQPVPAVAAQVVSRQLELITPG